VGGIEPQSRWQASAFLTAGSSSFADLLTTIAPELLPASASAAAGGGGPASKHIPHGTTIVAAVSADGVVMAGDRRATAGNTIAHRSLEKVFRSDEYTCIGISGAVGFGFELIKLFQVELEHYEKLEGRSLSLEGKANRLAGLVRSNLGAAMQGFVVVPLLAGYDEETARGRIFSYDPTGGWYEEQRFTGVGSGSIFACGALKKLYRDRMSTEDAVLACMQALYDAADDDSATGGPDVSRRIFPVIATVTENGFERLSEEETARCALAVVNERLQLPDGPIAEMQQATS
jgi:proteasome beta subunit